MKIIVGTQNKAKIEAVKEALVKHPEFKDADVTGCAVESGVNNQPIGLDETITGAKNRARLSYNSEHADLAVGLESGIFPVPHTKSGYMDTTACAIYDGRSYHVGLSSCFEYPKKIVEMILQEGKEVKTSAVELGFSDDPSFCEREGMVGVLTKSVITRRDYTEQAVHMALVHLLNKTHYE